MHLVCSTFRPIELIFGIQAQYWINLFTNFEPNFIIFMHFLLIPCRIVKIFLLKIFKLRFKELKFWLTYVLIELSCLQFSINKFNL